MHATPLFDNDHQIIGAIEVNQDITEMKKVEKSFQQNLKQWDAIFDQSLFGMVYFSDNNTILRVNERLAGYLEKTSETLKGIAIDEPFEASSTSNIQNKIVKAKSGEVTAFQLSGLLKDTKKEFNMYFVHDNRQLSETATVGLVFIDR
jgi:PAS domain-containing protein